MNIPDYIEPFLGYRTWQWDSAGLVSLNGTRWPVGEQLVAHNEKCVNRLAFRVTPRRIKKSAKRHTLTTSNWMQNVLIEDISPPVHEAPAENCACGIYAAKNFPHLEAIGYVGAEHDYGVHGEVYLWGRIWDHDLGYRAQYAYPKSLTFTFNAMPFSIKEIQSRIGILTRYGVDMFLQTAWGERELMWSKETGFNPRAFECEAFTKLIQERLNWYTFKERERRMVPGETLVILGLGIGIIQSVDEVKSEVRVSMFNRQTHTISAMEITFNRQNYRWESTSTGTISATSTMRARA